MSEVPHKIIKQTKTYLENNKVKNINKALKLVNKQYQAHKIPQVNYSEALNVSMILANIEMGSETIISSLIYYSIRKTNLKSQQLNPIRDSNISIILQGLSEIDYMKRCYHTSTKRIKHSRNFRRLLLAVCPDIRVMIIEVARQLDIVRHLPKRNLSSKGKQKRALKTFYIYAPIAGRLGIETLKWRLQDEAFKQLKPHDYEKIIQFLNKNQVPRMQYVQDVLKQLKQRIKPLHIKNPIIYGRPKHIYSIYHKLVTKHKTFGQIYDFIGVRVITNTISECYAVLSLLQNKWHPVPHRFKDYIAQPKTNLYQSIHTTVTGPDDKPLEIQIRTKKMHLIDEYGVAAHWAYKRGIKNKVHINSTNKELNVFKQMIAMRGNTHNPYNLKSNLFNNHVYVFTPNHDVLELPAHAGPLDMAYKIHTEVGNHAVGATVNGKIVSWDYQLNDGDRVSIITSSSSSGPSRDWLKIVVSQGAKRDIRRFLRKQNRQANIDRGKQIITQKVRNAGYESLVSTDMLKEIADKENYNSLDQLFESIGLGNLSMVSFNNYLDRFVQAKEKTNQPSDDSGQPEINRSNHTKSLKFEHQKVNHGKGIIIARSNNFLFRISKCCNPVPGDKVVGYITKNNGISVHRIDCPKLKKMPRHLVKVRWANQEETGDNYLSSLEIMTYANGSVFNDILKAAQKDTKQVMSIQDKIKGNDNVITLNFRIANLKKLKDLMARLRGIKHVFKVVRKFS